MLANPGLPGQLVAASKAGDMEFEPKDAPCTLCNRCLLAAPEFPLGCLDESRLENEFPDDREERFLAMIERVFDLYRVSPEFEGKGNAD